MKKLLFILLPVILLSSCTSSGLDPTTWEEDKDFLLKADYSKSITEVEESFIDDKITYSIQDQTYFYSYRMSLIDCDQYPQLQHVHVMLTPDQQNFFFFGYDQTYTLVSSEEKVDKSNHVFKGITINFTLDKVIDSALVRFTCSEFQIYYGLTVKEG